MGVIIASVQKKRRDVQAIGRGLIRSGYLARPPAHLTFLFYLRHNLYREAGVEAVREPATRSSDGCSGHQTAGRRRSCSALRSAEW